MVTVVPPAGVPPAGVRLVMVGGISMSGPLALQKDSAR
jgi:hypothetical protein